MEKLNKWDSAANTDCNTNLMKFVYCFWGFFKAAEESMRMRILGFL